MNKTNKVNEESTATWCGLPFKSIEQQHAACVANWTDQNLCGNCLRHRPTAPAKSHRWCAGHIRNRRNAQHA